MAAVAVVPMQEDGYWRRLANQAHRSVQQDRKLGQMEALLEELSSSMEEGAWMRGLFQTYQKI